MLKLVDIHTYYGESHILHGVSLKVEEGSVVALLGRNGAGKTTILHSIMGATPPRHGVISYRGRKIIGLPPHKIAQMGLAIVPQGRRIFPSLSVRENLIMAARGRKKQDAWSLDKVYSFFPILNDRADLKGNLLSGGEQQMLTIGRALMTNPDLILMDEPSEGLAPLIVREVGDIISQLHQKGVSILLVEQNVPLALSVGSYVYILNKGEIIYESTAEHLRSDEETQVRYIGVTKYS